MSFSKLLLAIRAIPKTIYFNFKYLEFKDAIKFPILISHRVVLSKMKGNVIIDAPLKFSMIKIGFTEHPFFDHHRLRSLWHVDGTVRFKGNADIGNGTKLIIHGNLNLGSNFMISAHAQIMCRVNINFGDDVLVGWDCLFMDIDGHSISNGEGKMIYGNKAINIGNRVWVGARSTILKGVNISNDVIIAANSCVSKSFNESNCIIGGNPSKVIKKDITWKL